MNIAFISALRFRYSAIYLLCIAFFLRKLYEGGWLGELKRHVKMDHGILTADDSKCNSYFHTKNSLANFGIGCCAVFHSPTLLTWNAITATAAARNGNITTFLKKRVLWLGIHSSENLGARLTCKAIFKFFLVSPNPCWVVLLKLCFSRQYSYRFTATIRQCGNLKILIHSCNEKYFQ